ncbi:MAG: helix-turn-helix transcriptional regulator [Lachnospiraceae bacterium]|nr:helix-turn-helix transcriptional regulator [Lachnospiraceae bacterium]
MVDEAFIQNRISELRTKKGVSEYKMSLELGHSKSYIQSISSGRALPSMSEFLLICDYLGTTPKDFFDEDIAYPALVEELRQSATHLGEAPLKALLNTAELLNPDNQS